MKSVIFYTAALTSILSSASSNPCQASHYRTTLHELSTNTHRASSIAELSKLSLSIAGEMGRYEQLGRQQSHRYALAMGSINGKLAVLDDPKRAESYLKDAVQRATKSTESAKKRSNFLLKALNQAETQAQAQQAKRGGQVSSEMASLVTTRTERAEVGKQEYATEQEDLTNWEAALTSFSEGCSDDTSLNDCVSEMMRELPGGAGALV